MPNRRIFLSGMIAAPIVSIFPRRTEAMTIAKMRLFPGQSNARAAGTVGVGFPGGWTSDPGIKIWWYAAQAWQTYNPGVNTDWTGSTGWGAEAEYARLWRLDHPNDTLYIWKQAVDGTPLYPNGNPNAADWSPHSATTKQWVVLQQQVAASQAALVAQSLTPQIDSCLWFQGESDELDGRAVEYRGNLLMAQDLMRVNFSAPNMHLIIARILPYWNQSGGLVRQAHEWIGSLPGNAWVDIDDVGCIDQQRSHINAAGAVQVGARMYAAEQLIA